MVVEEEEFLVHLVLQVDLVEEDLHHQIVMDKMEQLILAVAQVAQILLMMVHNILEVLVVQE